MLQSQWTRIELQSKFHLANKQTLCTIQCKHKIIIINRLMFLFHHTQNFALNITTQLKLFVTLHKLEYLLWIFLKLFLFLFYFWSEQEKTTHVELCLSREGEAKREKERISHENKMLEWERESNKPSLSTL